MKNYLTKYFERKNAKNNKKNNKGFTLVEMIVVIAIIGVLAGVIGPKVSAYIGDATATSSAANAKTLYSTLNAYCTSQISAGTPVADGTYTGTLTSGAITLSDGATHSITTLGNYINLKELKDGDAISVTVTGNLVTSLTYTPNGGTAVTYPQS